jgi:hypothetical protein
VSTAVACSDLVQRFDALLDLWSRLAMRHVALGSACACGMGGVSLQLVDFELDIVGYLEDAGQRCGIEEVVRFFDELQHAEPRPQPLVRLLEDAQQERLPEVVAEWLLPKAERTLRSFAELHGGGMKF